MLILLIKLNIIFDYLMFQNNLANYVIYFIIFSLICNIQTSAPQLTLDYSNSSGLTSRAYLESYMGLFVTGSSL